MSVHRLAYWQWLPPTGRAFERTCVAVHGLTRNGRDYDVVAARLADEGWRVIAVDFVGRGQSEWLSDAALYGYPQYVSDMVVLLARLDVTAVDLWLGTSMGGLAGMFVASMPQQLVKRMILVDIGPMVPSASIVRIKAYVGSDPRFKTRGDAVAACKAILQTFGPHTDEQAEIVIRHYIVEKEGEWRFHYDPRIAVPFKAAPDVDVVLWPVWDQIKCPVLVLRGANSDVLLETTAAEMQTRGPAQVRVVTFAGVGHAPTLIVEDQVTAVLEFAKSAD
jgi:pimeloyl-ACP methyl ester carboxylesterase